MFLLNIYVQEVIAVIGYILWYGGYFHSWIQTITEGNINGENPQGHPRMQYIYQIVNDVQYRGYVEMKRLVTDRIEWRARVLNQSSHNDWEPKKNCVWYIMNLKKSQRSLENRYVFLAETVMILILGKPSNDNVDWEYLLISPRHLILSYQFVVKSRHLNTRRSSLNHICHRKYNGENRNRYWLFLTKAFEKVRYKGGIL